MSNLSSTMAKFLVHTTVFDKFLRTKEAARYVKKEYEDARVRVKVSSRTYARFRAYKARMYICTCIYMHTYMHARQPGDRRNDRKRATIPSGSTLPGRHVTIAEIELQWTVNDLISRICQSAWHRFRSLLLSNSTFCAPITCVSVYIRSAREVSRTNRNKAATSNLMTKRKK